MYLDFWGVVKMFLRGGQIFYLGKREEEREVGEVIKTKIQK